MSSPPEPVLEPAEKKAFSPAASLAERRADIEAKQAQAASLLAELECDGLLLFEPENFNWLTSGATAGNVLDPLQRPGLFVSSDVRSLLASNVDSQRLFDEELEGLGFQLKEWNWHQGREVLLNYLSRSRRLASDVPRPDCKPAGDQLRELRWVISDYELAAYRQLGQILSHALEATCRSVQLKQHEQEIAGHLSHRVLRHGAELVSAEVAADDRLRLHRRPSCTPAQVTRHCVVTATAQMYGLHATASRSVCFGVPDASFRKDHDAACKIAASYISSTWPDGQPAAVLQAGQRVYKINQCEHEWRLCPAGHITGRAAVEHLLTSQSQDNFRAGWAIVWQAAVGAASSCDTFVVTPQGPVMITAPGNWPKKRIRISGANFDRPDILQRS
jgi:Xaa-Pro aminopeptidase